MRSGDYIHEHPDWPHFTWDSQRITNLLSQTRYQQGWLLGQVNTFSKVLQEEASLSTLMQDVLKSSEIEGIVLNPEQVHSSLARHLGLKNPYDLVPDPHVEGVVDMVLDATTSYKAPLSEKRLCAWHASLFPTGRSGFHKITPGTWRTEASGPMQVISGPVGHEIIHFEAPLFDRLPYELASFLEWIEAPNPIDPILKAGIAHLWFLTIHPFEDGNGRIARALTDLLLARAEDSAIRYYSLSNQIRHERKAYYRILEMTQRGSLDITSWLQWFIGCLSRAIEATKTTLSSVLKRSVFWNTHAGVALNPRQSVMIHRLLEDFKGNLTTSKWAKMTHCSQDTAYRDILDLIEKRILVKNPEGGRTTSYTLFAEKNCHTLRMRSGD